jgi:hypothetical protein
MTYHNGKTLSLEYEPAGPLLKSYVGFQEFNAACDRFLSKRGLLSKDGWRRSEWLYGRRSKKAAS